MLFDFHTRLEANRALVENDLNQRFLTMPASELSEAMRYGVLNGGKRLRAYLVLETARLFGLEDKQALPAAAAIEVIHAYSLIHDDLPAMDDDELRRGQPTVHVKWDEATAILAGDALLTWAFALLCDEALGAADIRLVLVQRLAQAAGAAGMVLGQTQDIAAETAATQLSLEAVTALQSNKTGALFEWAATSGAILSRQDPEPLQRYAKAVGLAFQIQDDILDVEGDSVLAGKRVGKDAEAGKATFVSLLGLDQAKSRARALVEEANEALGNYDAAADPLRAVAKFAISRRM